jgi:putative PIN family toxin of toxin-antitoxin system
LKRVVIDANTLASGSVNPHPESATSLIYNELTGARLEVIICPELLGEITDTLHKPYFLDRAGETDVEDILAGIADACTMLEDPAEIETILRDPEDDYLVALARTAKAELIVTGDKDLLDHIDLEPPALNARQACELLGLTEPD